MDALNKLVEKFILLNKKMKRWQKVVSVLSAVVVFVTTYALILPAVIPPVLRKTLRMILFCDKIVKISIAFSYTVTTGQ